MKNYPIIFAAFCTMATLFAVLLRPDPSVRFEAETTNLEPMAALAMLDHHANGMDYHDTLKLTHARLALGAGDLAGARRSFSELLDPHKPLPDILDQLSEVALLERDLAEAAALAQRAQDIDPTQERRQRLGYWYRILKDSKSEREVLATAPPEALTSWEVERLGQLYLGSGDTDAFERVLSELAASDREDKHEFQHKLIAFYIGTEQFDTAANTAFDTFAKSDRDTALVQITLAGLIEKGAIDPARGLAIRILGSHPGVGHTLVTPFIRAGHGGIARGLQDGWLAATRDLTTEQWLALSSFAEITGDLSGLREALSRGVTSRADPVPGIVFLQFVRYAGARSLVPFRRYLTPDVLAEAPLVAAAWSGWMKDDAATYTHLMIASRLPMSDWDRSIWMSVAEGLKGTAYYTRLLTGTSSDAELRSALRATVIREGAAGPDG